MAALISGHGSHTRWVRVSHWVLAASVITLGFSGVIIFMAHPRLYWGNAGNDLTPALLELPIGRNYKHGGWTPETTFFSQPNTAISAVRTYDIFNQNGWARSLHFLTAWFLVVTSLLYLLTGLVSGHLWRHLMPKLRDFAPGRLWHDFRRTAVRDMRKAGCSETEAMSITGYKTSCSGVVQLSTKPTGRDYALPRNRVGSSPVFAKKPCPPFSPFSSFSRRRAAP